MKHSEQTQPLTLPRLTPKNVDEMKPEWLEILKRIPGDS